jgi:tyrosyl-tRNA synthetase
MVCGKDGDPLYLVSRNKNQYLMHREMLPVCTDFFFAMLYQHVQGSENSNVYLGYDPTGHQGSVLDQEIGGCDQMLGF